ncbi:MAG: hypothetical protein, partial [Olavius algarvensis Gamma 1 endosymbiont]
GREAKLDLHWNRVSTRATFHFLRALRALRALRVLRVL